MFEHYLWVEKYRPKRIDDCVLPKSLKKTFKSIVKSGQFLNLLLSGPPGIGKTTVARALVDTLNADCLIINGSLDGNIDTLRTTITTFASTSSLLGQRKVVIIDEADYLNCFPENQEVCVYENDELVVKKISDLIELEEFTLPSHNFKNQDIEKTTGYVINRGEKEVFEVEFEDGTTMMCTEDHPFFNSIGENATIESEELFAINENNS